MLTLTKGDIGTTRHAVVLEAIDPNEDRPYIPEDAKVRIVGPVAFVWNVAGGRKNPLVWRDLSRHLPFRLITYPAVRWVGRRLKNL